MIVPVLAIAGSLAAKKRMADDRRHRLPTHGPLFVSLLIGTVLLVGLLNYVPALALGPVDRAPDVVVPEVKPSSRNPRTTLMTSAKTFSLLDPALVKPAVVSAFGKLDPRVQWRNPVMFVVYVGSIITTILWVAGPGWAGRSSGRASSSSISLWLWFTVLFANFAEAMAEGRSKAQAVVAARHEAARPSAKRARSSAPPRPRRGIRRRPTNCARARSCWSRPAT